MAPLTANLTVDAASVTAALGMARDKLLSLSSAMTRTLEGWCSLGL
jgi:hypothetical protein